MYHMYTYTVNDGIPSMRDSAIELAWEKLIESGCHYWMNYSGEIEGYSDFYEIATNPYNVFCLICKEDIPVAVCWVNDVVGRTGEVHFCTFKDIWGRETIAVGKFVLDCLGQSFRTLTGRTPTANSLACKFIQKIGMKKMCTIEGGWYNAYDDVMEDCILTHIDFRGEAYGRE